jgi:hypothetical protein
MMAFANRSESITSVLFPDRATFGTQGSCIHICVRWLHRARPSFMYAQFVRSTRCHGEHARRERGGKGKVRIERPYFYFGSESRGHTNNEIRRTSFTTELDMA